MGGKHYPYDKFDWNGEFYELEDLTAEGYSVGDVESSLRNQGFREIPVDDFDVVLESGNFPIEVRIDLDEDYMEVDLGYPVYRKEEMEAFESLDDVHRKGLFKMKETEMHEAIDQGHEDDTDSMEFVYMMELRKQKKYSPLI